MVLNVKGEITKLCGGWGAERIVSGQIIGRDQSYHTMFQAFNKQFNLINGRIYFE